MSVVCAGIVSPRAVTTDTLVTPLIAEMTPSAHINDVTEFSFQETSASNFNRDVIWYDDSFYCAEILNEGATLISTTNGEQFVSAMKVKYPDVSSGFLSGYHLATSLGPPPVDRSTTSGGETEDWSFLGNVPQQFSHLDPVLAEIDVDELLKYFNEN